MSGLEGVIVYLDDILVMAPDEEIHDHRLLEKLNDWGFRLQVEKCNIKTKNVKYLGFIVVSPKSTVAKAEPILLRITNLT